MPWRSCWLIFLCEVTCCWSLQDNWGLLQNRYWLDFAFQWLADCLRINASFLTWILFRISSEYFLSCVIVVKGLFVLRVSATSGLSKESLLCSGEMFRLLWACSTASSSALQWLQSARTDWEDLVCCSTSTRQSRTQTGPQKGSQAGEGVLILSHISAAHWWKSSPCHCHHQGEGKEKLVTGTERWRGAAAEGLTPKSEEKPLWNDLGWKTSLRWLSPNVNGSWGGDSPANFWIMVLSPLVYDIFTSAWGTAEIFSWRIHETGWWGLLFENSLKCTWSNSQCLEAV